MAEEEADDPGMDEGARRLGEEQHPAGPEHAMELLKRRLLLEEMVKRLVAENEIDARIRNAHRGDIAVMELDRRGFLGCLGTRALQASPIGLHTDDPLGREAFDQRPEGLSLATAHVKDHRIRRLSLRDEPHEVLQRHRDHPLGPGARSQEPKTDARLRNEVELGRGMAAHRRGNFTPLFG